MLGKCQVKWSDLSNSGCSSPAAWSFRHAKAWQMPRIPNFKVTLTRWCQDHRNGNDGWLLPILVRHYETENHKQPETSVTSRSLSFFHHLLLRAILKEAYEGLHRLWSLQNSSCLRRLTWSSIPSLSASSSENSGSLSTSEGGGDGLRSRQKSIYSKYHKYHTSKILKIHPNHPCHVETLSIRHSSQWNWPSKM